MRRTPLAWILSLLLATLPVAASAHAILVDSEPTSGAGVHGPHLALKLRFNSRIDAARSRLLLTGPDHVPHVLPFAAGPSPDLLLGAAELSPGAYVLRWQVLAVDGHITRGDVPFSVTAPPAAP